MELTRLLVPTFIQALKSLSAWLDKAAAHDTSRGLDPESRMSERLAPDMFPLAAQIRFACFQAQEPVHRLRGEPLPATLLEVRQEAVHSNTQTGTLAQSQARIAETVAFLSSLDADALDSTSDSPIALDLPNGIVFDMTGEQYARDWCLPQFYFHVVTAYDILRHHGIDLGKRDYVGHMFAYLRPGTMPKG